MNSELLKGGNQVQIILGSVSDVPESEMVTIKLPSDIATFLSTAIEHDRGYLRLILNETVFNSLIYFFDHPSDSKKILDNIVFDYTGGIAERGECLESDHVYFLQSVNNFFQSCFDVLEKKLKEGGENV